MLTILTKYVWVERAMVTVAALASAFGWASQSDVSTVAAGGIAGVTVFVQILGAVLTHVRTVETKVETGLAAAQAAGKAAGPS